MKYFVINISYRAPLAQMIDDEAFEEDFNSDPAKLEKHFTASEGMGFWPNDGGFVPIIQDVMVKDLPADIDKGVTK